LLQGWDLIGSGRRWGQETALDLLGIAWADFIPRGTSPS